MLGHRHKPGAAQDCLMLETLIVVLLLLWLLGVTTAYSFGGLIHLLLVIAIVITLIRVIRGRKV